RQQAGYGFAEACLRRRYPGRFNVFGYPVWQGSIHDSHHASLRQQGLPTLFRPRVYQGLFGSAQFQSLYHPFQTWWFQAFMTVEWEGAAASVLGAGGLALGAAPAAGLGLLGLGTAMVAATLGAALTAGQRAARARGWRGGERWRGLL